MSAFARACLTICLAGFAASSQSASATTFAVPTCRAAEKQSDGSWRILTTVRLGRAGVFPPDSILYRGGTFNGVDPAAMLDRVCFTRYALVPDYPPYLWAPNGYPNIATRIP